MSVNGRYSVSAFIKDASAVLEGGGDLEDKKADIADRLSHLSRRDDLTRTSMPLGPADASTANYLLYREPPYTSLLLAQFDPGYLSPIHAHGDFWVVACGYRGRDRWDMYERRDDGTQPGYAEIALVDQYHIPPGRSVWMPRPPRAIHSHNNEHDALTLELIFTAAKPSDPADRLIYDAEEKACFPSPWAPGVALAGDTYPPRPLSRIAGTLGKAARRALCPICAVLGTPAPARLACASA
jgi:predicted metal-dependent enzyme (double-stranded beta helix superfamily)